MVTKNIIHTQENFTISYEGKTSLKHMIALKLDRIIYTRVEPMWDKVNYFFEHQGMNGYDSKQ